MNQVFIFDHVIIIINQLGHMIYSHIQLLFLVEKLTRKSTIKCQTRTDQARDN